MGAGLSVVVTYCAGYALACRTLPFRKVIMAFILVTMFFNGGLIPTYLLNKNIGLINNPWVLVLPVVTSAWGIFLARNFLYMQPKELQESAYIDGAGIIRTMVSVVVPLSKPIIAVIFLFSAVSHWNAWFDAYLYMAGSKVTVLQMVLRRLLAEIAKNTPNVSGMMEVLDVVKPPDKAIVAATIIVTIGPILILYPFLQKYFVKGIMVGSLKG